MARPRTELHAELVNLLGSNNVYYQPPASVHLAYPAIVYHRNDINCRKADNDLYTVNVAYTVIHIGYDPDAPAVFEILQHFEHCQFDRQFAADGLYHDVFTIYY